MATSAGPDQLLAIYLNDHLAGAALGLELARRLRSENRGDPEIGERLGRLKPNGQLRGYSPLSRVLELEGMAGLIGAKIQLWNALEQNFGETLDGFDFHALAARADNQGQRVEDLHLGAARRALPIPPS